MPKEFDRRERVADQLQEELARLIARELRDPRVGMVDVTAVHVTRDLSHAKVFVTFLPDGDKAVNDERVAVLNNASGFLRSSLAKTTTTRGTPKLRFVFDESVQRGSHLSDLIDKAVGEDKQRQAQVDRESAADERNSS